MINQRESHFIKLFVCKRRNLDKLLEDVNAFIDGKECLDVEVNRIPFHYLVIVRYAKPFVPPVLTEEEKTEAERNRREISLQKQWENLLNFDYKVKKIEVPDRDN